jgi:hypothetical protein
MDFEELGPPDYHQFLLGQSDRTNNNQSFRMKRISILFASISLTIVIIGVFVSMLLIYMRTSQQKSLPIHESITRTTFNTTIATVFPITNTKLELSGKKNFVVLDSQRDECSLCGRPFSSYSCIMFDLKMIIIA